MALEVRVWVASQTRPSAPGHCPDRTPGIQRLRLSRAAGEAPGQALKVLAREALKVRGW
jgi:hypothetical protein